MVVVVNRGADSGVVLAPFFSCDATITVFVSKVLKELQEDFINGLLSRLHLGVHGAVVDAFKVGGSDRTITIGVELKVGLVNQSLSLGVE